METAWQKEHNFTGNSVVGSDAQCCHHFYICPTKQKDWKFRFTENTRTSPRFMSSTNFSCLENKRHQEVERKASVSFMFLLSTPITFNVSINTAVTREISFV